MSMRLADRLSAARQRRFAGRSAELSLFRDALAADEPPFAVLYVYGPGGIGKTTLLGEFAALAAQSMATVYSLDARMLEAAPAAFTTMLQHVMGVGPDDAPAQVLAERGERAVIQIDTYEQLLTLDPWLRDEFLPQLPDGVIIVMAGREPPPLAWQIDLGWQQLFRTLPLRNLSPSESDDYLSRRSVPPEQRRRVLDFTRGHPLALSLVADLFAQRSHMSFQPEEAPDVIKTLLELFVQKVPGPAHRVALEICALANLTTEPLLAAMMGVSEARELFEWLRGLSFITSTRLGLFPHDLAREALAADLRWRNPAWYAELHRRARDYYSARLQQTSDEEQQRILFDYIFLHRTNPIVQPFYEWQQGYTLITTPAKPADIPGILELVTQYEGAESAAIAAYWLEHQLDGALVVREAGAPSDVPIAAFLLMVGLERTTPGERAGDPAIDAAWRLLQQRAPLRPRERATHFRFWMSREAYQGIAPGQTVLVVQIVRHYLITAGLAYTFFPVADPGFWAPLAAYADLERLEQADFSAGGQTYGVFGHDWRATSPTAWLALLAERELADDALSVRPPPTAPQLVVLSEPAFLQAVEEAIQNYARPDRLYDSALLQSRIVVERAGRDAATPERVSALQELIRTTTELLQSSPRDLRLYRAVYHTYIQPAATQERAAELLDLPFSTYRRHLKNGLTRIAELLWKIEIDEAVNKK